MSFEEDVRQHNRRAWDQYVKADNRWTRPVGPEVIAAARRGDWALMLTPSRPVPRDWLPDLAGAEILSLASGGGQQAPILAAAGARVTVLDNSPRQLAQDHLVAEREGLDMRSVQGDMADLSAFPDDSFDLIAHPVSNNFVPAVKPVWREAFRVLKPGGALLAGFSNPVVYLFDEERYDSGFLEVTRRLPHADSDHLSAAERARMLEKGVALEFSHSLEDLIGGQAEAGFLITGLFEDRYDESEKDLLTRFMPTFIVTQAIKPPR